MNILFIFIVFVVVFVTSYGSLCLSVRAIWCS